MRRADGWCRPGSVALNGHDTTVDSCHAERSLAEARRALRVRLLRDLVSNGLYRVRSGPLAERMLMRLDWDVGPPED